MIQEVLEFWWQRRYPNDEERTQFSPTALVLLKQWGKCGVILIKYLYAAPAQMTGTEIVVNNSKGARSQVTATAIDL